ncbi:MAG: hypothetical protein OQK73_02245 [Gammaproteobacteria bacterium]|nr:hypothetical protein [Gammaproteobacteria bacterium]
MLLRKIVLISSLMALLPACAIQHPQNADEFRQAAPTAFMARVESFTVDRPFKDVANSFKEKAPKCLNVRVKTTSRTSTSYQVIVTRFTPTVKVTKKRAELHVQQQHEQGVMNVSKVPDGGYYLMIADAYPLANNKTMIEMFRPSMGFDPIVNAIKDWANGKTEGCPDLTKL